ncbi:MAG: hypothetical protein H6978_07045 [Gammaproteobacteria bacterium]|nr:hypothetical protein [Gammaproteobacteria bacterium]
MMSHTIRITRSVAASASGLIMLVASHAAIAQHHPRTAWGDPDITGVYSEFTTAPLERDPQYGDREFFTPEEHEQASKLRISQAYADDDTVPGTQGDVHYSMEQYGLSENEGVTSLNLRTSIVTEPKNGRIPPLNAQGAARRDALAAARKGHEMDGPESRNLQERCVIWPMTIAPILPRGYNGNLQIFQSPGYVVIQGEMGDARAIPTDGRAFPDILLPQWNGTSIGRWEGETFVIETRGFHPETAWRGATQNMRVTERLTRLNDDTLEYRFSVVDPDTWDQPWGGVYPLTRLDGLLYEYACTEGNYGLTNILAGARKGEQDAAAK